MCFRRQPPAVPTQQTHWDPHTIIKPTFEGKMLQLQDLLEFALSYLLENLTLILCHCGKHFCKCRPVLNLCFRQIVNNSVLVGDFEHYALMLESLFLFCTYVYVCWVQHSLCSFAMIISSVFNPSVLTSLNKNVFLNTVCLRNFAFSCN